MAATLGLSLPVASEPAMRGSWIFSCASTVTEVEIAPGDSRRLTFSHTNADSLARRIRIVLELAPLDGGAVPDAWRFDAAGCQGDYGLLWDTYIAAAVKTCPLNLPPNQQSVWHATSLAQEGDRLRLEFERVFGGPPDVATGDRLVLSLRFDHLWSVAGPATDAEHCGGFERGVCVRLIEATHESFAGLVRPYVRTNSVYSANAGGLGSCEVVPVRATTWGAIKGQYR